MQNRLPKDWKLVPIAEIGKIETGTTPSKAISEYYGTEFPFYKPSDLEAGINVCKSIDGLTKLGVDKARYIPEFTTLVTCIGATIGKTGFIKTGGGFNQQINAIIPNEKSNPKFIYYQAISLGFQKQIKANASATTLPLLNKSKFQLLTMVTCSIETQQAIVLKIEELFSELDKGIEDLKTAQQQLKTYRQSVLKWAFEGKLTNENVKEGELPEGWEIKTLKELTLKVEKVKRKEVNEDEKLIYLDIGGLDNNFNKIENYKTYNWKEAPSRAQQIVKVNDVLFSTVRTYMKNIAIVDKEIFNNQIASSGFTVLRANEQTNFKYIFYNTISDIFLNPLNELQTGSSYPAVRDSDVFNQKISIPKSLEEQHQIVQEIESRLSVADKMEESIAQSLQQAEALRQSILKKAFSGELV